MRRLYSVIVTALVLMGITAAVATPAGAVTRSQIQAKVLSLANMPAGWRAENPSGGSDTYTGCLRTIHPSANSSAAAHAFYVNHDSVPTVGEVLANGSKALRGYRVWNKVLSTCKKLGGTASGVHITGTVSAISFPAVGTRSRAYAISLSAGGIAIDVDVITFEVGKYAGELLYEDIGQPNIAQVKGFVDESIAKIEGKPTTPPQNVDTPAGNLN